MEYLTSLMTLASLVLTQGLVHLPNEPCKPRPTLIRLGHPTYNYFPFFVLLHRCGGSFGLTSPADKQCMATAYTDISIMQFSLGHTSNTKVTVKRNHTQCGYRCVKNQSDCNKYERWDPVQCKCNCLYNNSNPPTPCPVGFTWNRHWCKCECGNVPDVCEAKKNWSKVECKCVDNIVGPTPRVGRSRKRNHFLNSEKKGVSSTLFVVFIVVEFAVLYIVFDAILYHRQAGIFYRIHLKLKTQAPTLESVIKDEIKPGDPIVTTIEISRKETAI